MLTRFRLITFYYNVYSVVSNKCILRVVEEYLSYKSFVTG